VAKLWAPTAECPTRTACRQVRVRPRHGQNEPDSRGHACRRVALQANDGIDDQQHLIADLLCDRSEETYDDGAIQPDLRPQGAICRTARRQPASGRD
jgi:hypothetical protein